MIVESKAVVADLFFWKRFKPHGKEVRLFHKVLDYSHSVGPSDGLSVGVSVGLYDGLSVGLSIGVSVGLSICWLFGRSGCLDFRLKTI